jgi:hypothetical protein
VPANSSKLNLFKGALLHIEDYDSKKGFERKAKFAFIVGRKNPNTVIAFLITSQKTYLKSVYARELVRVEVGINSHLKQESYILCHQQELLDVAELEAGFANSAVTNCGSLRSLLSQVRAVVEDSDVLGRHEIDEILAILDS